MQGIFIPASINRIALISSLLVSLNVYAVDQPAAEDDVIETESALDRRIAIERKTRYQPFVLTPHKPNYLLPFTYNNKPNIPAGTEVNKYEIKFQLSIKFPITESLLQENDSLQFGYTNLSFWQAYDQQDSSPFRETVHEPELFYIFANDWQFMGMMNRLVQLGFSHQSNGRSGSASRSWNRFYMDFIFERNNFYLSFKPWYIFENAGTTVRDNPDIDDYMGQFELRGVYTNHEHTVSLMLRNNLKTPNFGAVEFNWSFPLSRRAKWFLQYFNGYGESLIDYDAQVNRVGIGIAFTDWL